MEPVDRGAMLQGQVVELGIAGIVVVDLEHAVKTTRGRERAAQ